MEDGEPLLGIGEEQEDKGNYISSVPPEVVEQPPSAMLPIPPKLSENNARLALLSLASAEDCYGTRAASGMVFNRITPSWAFHYQLKTFTEGRNCTWTSEPYIGQEIDGPENGPAPDTWDIHVQPSQLFNNHTLKGEVPHTASVKGCHECMGAGKHQCGNCMQSGREVCGRCNGSGRVLKAVPTYHLHGDGVHAGVGARQVFCDQCNGTGRNRCSICNGYGQVVCETCSGHCQLKHYIELTVTWKTSFNEHIVDRTGLPNHIRLLKRARGTAFFEEQQPRVAPVTNFPDSAVNSASQQLVHSHATAFPTERIFMQHHLLLLVPVWKIECSWGRKTFPYWVYGYDNQVSAPDYPQTCCWCYNNNNSECTLL